MTKKRDEIVGQRIKMCRKKLRLSQRALGEKVGVKFQQIQKYESGEDRVAASRLWDISVALDVPIAFFFVVDESIETLSDEFQRFYHSAEVQSFLHFCMSLPAVQRQAIVRLAKSMSVTI